MTKTTMTTTMTRTRNKDNSNINSKHYINIQAIDKTLTKIFYIIIYKRPGIIKVTLIINITNNNKTILIAGILQREGIHYVNAEADPRRALLLESM